MRLGHPGKKRRRVLGRAAGCHRQDGAEEGGRLRTLLLGGMAVWVLCPPTPLLGRSNVWARQVGGKGVQRCLQLAWCALVAVRVEPWGQLRSKMLSQKGAWRKEN
ncbi:hypothetical protein NDU88_003834 [Pleurodeles waltl]|uniref:Uncharacterized protein n=1 Tax=Pleurodeles waltl TaxID=8319 RepID=A0AAV7PDT0_PLEWA|nr:hypothetical protein NDU88_003834 [Pleurodeles waltl]